MAKSVWAPEYDTKPPLTTNYYSYHSGFAADDLEEYVRDYQAVGCFPTHDGLTLIAVLWPSGRFVEIRGDVEGHSGRRSSPRQPSPNDYELRGAKRSGSARPVFPIFFVNCSARGGRSLATRDNKNPITAQGISDAFIDSDALAQALDNGWSGRRELDDALAEHQASRDQRSKPMYDFTCQMATLEPPPPHMQQLFAALRDNQEAMNQFYSAITGSRPLPTFMNQENIDRITATP